MLFKELNLFKESYTLHLFRIYNTHFMISKSIISKIKIQTLDCLPFLSLLNIFLDIP